MEGISQVEDEEQTDLGWQAGCQELEAVRLWQNQEGTNELLIMETSDPKRRDYLHFI